MGLIADHAGNIFGITTNGGELCCSAAFEFAKGDALKTLASYAFTNGAYPQASLSAGADDIRYGPSYPCGAYSRGTVFSISGFGGSVAAVPKPATWAVMLVGFGFAGNALRSRRRVTLASVG